MSAPVSVPPLSALQPIVPGQGYVTARDTVATVTERVLVQPVVPAPEHLYSPTAYLAVADEAWGWEELRDYVVRQIFQVVGTFPRDRAKEKSIFSAFLGRFGPDAPRIARYAFEIAGGYWKNAPISVNRFCKASDAYFGQPILEHLAQARAGILARS